MFAAPNMSDVEAQRTAQPAAAYGQQTDSSMKMQQTQQTVTTTTSGQPAGAAPQEGPSKSTISKFANTLQWGTFMFLLAFFSLIVMIAAAQVCSGDQSGTCLGTRAYQVSVGTISLVVAFIFGLLDFMGLFSSPGAQLAISFFLFLWWIAGVIVLTFFGDFQQTTQAAGYFATWFAFITTGFALVNSSSEFETGLDKTAHSIRKPLFALIFASLVVMGAAIGPCSGPCSGYEAWAIVASVVSLGIAIILFFMPSRLERKTMKGIAWLFVLWWVFASSCLTLGAPFRIAGNGFFGCYAALLASVVLCAELYRAV